MANALSPGFLGRLRSIRMFAVVFREALLSLTAWNQATAMVLLPWLWTMRQERCFEARRLIA